MENDKSKFKGSNFRTSDVHNSGQSMLVVAVFFLLVSLLFVLGFSSSALSSHARASELLNSKKSYFLAESGVEDLSYRISIGMLYNSSETVSIDGSSVMTSVLNLSGNEKQVTATGSVSNLIRKVKTILTNDTGVAFHYGVQVGNGGLRMENSAMVSGNVYSNGPINGFNSNSIQGDAVAAGAAGLISGANIAGSAYANSIINSTISGDAYYDTDFSGSSALGALYPGSPYQPSADLPISDAQISDWEAGAEAASVINSPCPYIINSNVSLGPVKINCDLEINGTPTVNLLGNVWVAGNIKVQNSPIIKIDPSFGAQSIVMIADNPLNRTTSSKVEIANSATFQNSGTSGSYVLVISQNNSAELGGGERALEAENSVTGALLVYAGHGEIRLKNNIALKEVSGYRIHIQNNANIQYETGLANLLFQSGPAGGYSIKSWREIK